MIVKAVDSYSAPSAQQRALAKAAGVSGWNGYLPGPGIDSTWTEADFATLRADGFHSIAYASGRADPAQQKQLAASWGVKGCLDVEASIRADGPWVQQWLDASGFGLYGAPTVHPNRSAAFHVLAEWPGSDPNSCWSSPVPASPPRGWQWAGNVVLYAATVDLCWFDTAIYGTTPVPSPAPKPPEDDMQPVIVIVNAQVGDYLLFPNGNYVGIASGPDLTAFASLGYKQITVSETMHQRLVAAAPNQKGS